MFIFYIVSGKKSIKTVPSFHILQNNKKRRCATWAQYRFWNNQMLSHQHKLVPSLPLQFDVLLHRIQKIFRVHGIDRICAVVQRNKILGHRAVLNRVDAGTFQFFAE